MTDRQKAFNEKCKPGLEFDIWNYFSQKPFTVKVGDDVTDEAFTVLFLDSLGGYTRIYFTDEWLEDTLREVEIYNSPLGQALL